MARSHVGRVKGRAAGQGFAHAGKLEHRASVRVAGDEAIEARIGAGKVGVDRDRQHRLYCAPNRLAVDDERALPKLDRVAGQADHALDIVDTRHRMFEHDDTAALRGSEETTSRLPALLRHTYACLCLKK